MSDYNRFSFRLVDVGLNLRDAPDKVSEGRWIKLINVRSSQEALISSRDGLNIVFTTPFFNPIHTIRRLDDNLLAIGTGQELVSQSSIVWALSGFSGFPMSIVPFKPERSSEIWGYVGDRDAMVKIQADGSIFQWGVDPPLPTITPPAIGLGTGNLDTTVQAAIPYKWRFTYYSSRTGAESNGSSDSNEMVGAGFRAQIGAVGSLDPQVDRVRFYRIGGTQTQTYRLVGDAPNVPGGTVIFEDNASDQSVALAEPLPETNHRPFQSVDSNGLTAVVNLPYVSEPFLGKYLLACGDELRPGYLYWTNPGDPDSASQANNVSITSPSEPLTGVFVYNGRPFVWTRDNLYAVEFGTQGITFDGRKTACGRGISGPWAYAVGPMIYFLSKDGIYATTGDSPAESITEESLRPIFNGISVEGFLPVDFSQENFLRLYYAGQELHFTYKDTSGELQHLYWHSYYQRWKQADRPSIGSVTIYGDQNQNALQIYAGGSNGILYRFDSSAVSDGGTAILMEARTGFLDFSAPQTMKEFGNIILDADPNGNTITITPYLNGRTDQSLPSFNLTGSGRQKFSFSLSDTYAYSIAFDIQCLVSGAGRPSIYQFDIQWRMDEEEINHWEFPETSHGLSGWQMVRDGYIAIRSTSDVTLTISVDGTSYTYLLPSTSGAKRKIYVPFRPTKGKLYRYSLDSTQDFRLYGADCEIRTKSWNTSMSFQLVSPFAPKGEEGE